MTSSLGTSFLTHLLPSPKISIILSEEFTFTSLSNIPKIIRTLLLKFPSKLHSLIPTYLVYNFFSHVRQLVMSRSAARSSCRSLCQTTLRRRMVHSLHSLYHSHSTSIVLL